MKILRTISANRYLLNIKVLQSIFTKLESHRHVDCTKKHRRILRIKLITLKKMLKAQILSTKQRPTHIQFTMHTYGPQNISTLLYQYINCTHTYRFFVKLSYRIILKIFFKIITSLVFKWGVRMMLDTLYNVFCLARESYQSVRIGSIVRRALA